MRKKDYKLRYEDCMQQINHVNKYLLEGMTKENFGKIWGLDHIVPIDLFDINDEAEKKLCYNYQNIIPMFNIDNRVKGASVHFSLAKLETMYTNVYIQQLKEKCLNEIANRYDKYLICVSREKSGTFCNH